MENESRLTDRFETYLEAYNAEIRQESGAKYNNTEILFIRDAMLQAIRGLTTGKDEKEFNRYILVKNAAAIARFAVEEYKEFINEKQ